MSLSFKTVIKWEAYNVIDIFEDIAMLKAICLNATIC